MIEQAFIVTDTVGKYNVEIRVVGGGVTGQAGAIKHGISRALVRSERRLSKAPCANTAFLLVIPGSRNGRSTALNVPAKHLSIPSVKGPHLGE